MNKQVWIDTDLSAGMKRYTRPGYSDVDDGYAILQLMHSDTVTIRGISAVFGNTRIDDAYKLCKEMASDYALYEIPVYKGAGEAINLEHVVTNNAVEALAKALKVEKLTIMAIGPATNVGLLILLYPELASQIKEVILVAGRRKPTDYFAIGTQGARARDLNFDLDNDAFRVMFEAEVSVTLCPFEISSKVWITENHLEQLSKRSEGSQWIANHSIAWLEQWKQAGAAGFNPFDVLASHYLIAPDDIISEPLLARLEIHENDTIMDNDKTVFKNYLLCDHSGIYPVKYCYDVVQGFHEKLIGTFK